jgi:hypothetical protein
MAYISNDPNEGIRQVSGQAIPSGGINSFTSPGNEYVNKRRRDNSAYFNQRPREPRKSKPKPASPASTASTSSTSGETFPQMMARLEAEMNNRLRGAPSGFFGGPKFDETGDMAQPTPTLSDRYGKPKPTAVPGKPVPVKTNPIATPTVAAPPAAPVKPTTPPAKVKPSEPAKAPPSAVTTTKREPKSHEPDYVNRMGYAGPDGKEVTKTNQQLWDELEYRQKNDPELVAAIAKNAADKKAKEEAAAAKEEARIAATREFSTIQDRPDVLKFITQLGFIPNGAPGKNRVDSFLPPSVQYMNQLRSAALMPSDQFYNKKDFMAGVANRARSNAVHERKTKERQQAEIQAHQGDPSPERDAAVRDKNLQEYREQKAQAEAETRRKEALQIQMDKERLADEQKQTVADFRKSLEQEAMDKFMAKLRGPQSMTLADRDAQESFRDSMRSEYPFKQALKSQQKKRRASRVDEDEENRRLMQAERLGQLTPLEEKVRMARMAKKAREAEERARMKDLTDEY